MQLIEPMADDSKKLVKIARTLISFSPVGAGCRGRSDAWRNWRRRTFARVAGSVGLVGARPYDLRHSFVSLLIAEGPRAGCGRQAGHSPTMTLNVYGHVFDDFDRGWDKRSAAGLGRSDAG